MTPVPRNTTPPRIAPHDSARRVWCILVGWTCLLGWASSGWSQPPDEPVQATETAIDPAAADDNPAVETGAADEARAAGDEPESEPGSESASPITPHSLRLDPNFQYETSSLAFPTPPELFRSLSKAGSTRWRQLYRPPVPDLGSDRHRGALALGTVFADLYLAAEAADIQHLRNTGHDAVSLGRGLGVGEHLAPFMHELGVAADEGHWDQLRKRLQISLNDLNDRLHSQRDDDLVILIDLGMWLRVLEISAQAVVEDEEFARPELCIGAVTILMQLRTRHGELSEAARKCPEIDAIGIELIRLVWRWDGRSGVAPTHDDVEASYIKIRNLLRRLLQRA